MRRANCVSGSLEPSGLRGDSCLPMAGAILICSKENDFAPSYCHVKFQTIATIILNCTRIRIFDPEDSVVRLDVITK